MSYSDAQDTLNQFVVELYLQTQGDSSKTVSWFDIGEALGLDRAGSSRAAEKIIGTGLAEIKTLNGSISITEDGIEAAQKLGAVINVQSSATATLGDAPILDQQGSQAVEQIAGELKKRMGEKGWGFDTLSDLMTDLKSIDAQLSLPHPETAAIRECFLSIMSVLEKENDAESLARVQTFLG